MAIASMHQAKTLFKFIVSATSVRKRKNRKPSTEKPTHRGVKASLSQSHVLNTLSSAGQPLDHQTRAFFEPRLGYDLKSVRIHTDSTAAESARAVEARAYTLGRDIVFAEGEFHPSANTGRELLAHELAHVVQGGPQINDKLQRTSAGKVSCANRTPSSFRAQVFQSPIRWASSQPRRTGPMRCSTPSSADSTLHSDEYAAGRRLAGQRSPILLPKVSA